MVYHQEEQEWQHRWTTWSLDTDSTLLYQPTDSPNKLFIGNDGHIYQLDDETATDDGKAIHIEIQTGPIPEVTQEVLGHTYKRIHRVGWQLATPPPATGYTVELTLTDVNDAANTVTRVVQQFSAKIRVGIALRCRQAFLSLKTNVGKDFDIVMASIEFQQSIDRSTAGEDI